MLHFLKRWIIENIITGIHTLIKPIMYSSFRTIPLITSSIQSISSFPPPFHCFQQTLHNLGTLNDGISNTSNTLFKYFRFSIAISSGFSRSLGTSTICPSSSTFCPILRILFLCCACTAAYASFPRSTPTWYTGSFENIGFSYAFPYASTNAAAPFVLFVSIFTSIASVGGGGLIFGISGSSMITSYFASVPDDAADVPDVSSSWNQRRAAA